MKSLVSLALLSAGLVHGQTSSQVQDAIFAIHEKAETMAVERCKSFQKLTFAQPRDANLTVFEQVVDKREMIACIDDNTASNIALANAISVDPSIKFLTMSQVTAIQDYADEHFPRPYDAHTLAEWREAYAHRDDPTPQLSLAHRSVRP
jgi:hypothetical protein